MKKKLVYLYVFSVVLFSDFKLFAQPGDESDDPDPNDELEDGDAQALPINGKLFWLAIAGILFAYYTYKRNKQLRQSN